MTDENKEATQRLEGRGFHDREQHVPKPWTEHGLGLLKGKEGGQCS